MSRAGFLFMLNMGIWTVMFAIAALVYGALEQRRKDREDKERKDL